MRESTTAPAILAATAAPRTARAKSPHPSPALSSRSASPSATPSASRAPRERLPPLRRRAHHAVAPRGRRLLDRRLHGLPQPRGGVLRVKVEIFRRAELELHSPDVGGRLLRIGLHPLPAVEEEILPGHEARVLHVIVQPLGGRAGTPPERRPPPDSRLPRRGAQRQALAERLRALEESRRRTHPSLALALGRWLPRLAPRVLGHGYKVSGRDR